MRRRRRLTWSVSRRAEHLDPRSTSATCAATTGMSIDAAYSLHSLLSTVTVMVPRTAPCACGSQITRVVVCLAGAASVPGTTGRCPPAALSFAWSASSSRAPVATQEARFLEQNSGWPSKGRPREWSRCGRYPRLDFFASPECRVVHGSAACDSADKECGDQCPTETNTFEHFRSPFEQLTGARGAAPVTQLLPQMNSCCRRVNSCEHQA